MEYMEERTRKARKIVERIEVIRKTIHIAKENDLLTVAFSSFNKPGFKFSDQYVVKELKEEFIRLAEKEVDRLEQELAEL